MGSQPYEIGIIDNGPGGRILYAEGERVLAFEWQFCAEGAAVSVPTPQEWDAYCEKDDAGWAVGRRMEILERVAHEVRRQKEKTAVISYRDGWIILAFEDPWVFSLLKKLFRR